jgi:hypothetical protein
VKDGRCSCCDIFIDDWKMAETNNSTGYGPSANASGSRYARLMFDGDERKFE